MLALLPELDDANPRQALGMVMGPKLTVCEATPEVAQRIRDVELGKAEPPTLFVDSGTGRLVLLKRQEAALADWLVYKLGSFSTCHAKYLVLTSAERAENNRLFHAAQMLSTDKLVALLGTTQDELPLTEDDLPLEDDDDFPHEEDEGAEEDR